MRGLGARTRVEWIGGALRVVGIFDPWVARCGELVAGNLPGAGGRGVDDDELVPRDPRRTRACVR
jgi:hypothetical protein